MNKIKWCLKQKNGVELISINENLATAYFSKASDSLETMGLAKASDWRISTAYYSMYFSVYALCMKCGIKSEIHSCTLELIDEFFTKYLTTDDRDLLHKAFRARNDAQYYVDREIENITFNLLINSAAAFVSKCKRIKDKLTEKEVNQIREKINSLI